MGELEQERQDMIKMMEAKGKADIQKHVDLKVDRQKIQDDHSSERRERDAQIAKLQMRINKEARQGKRGVYSKGGINGDGNDPASGSHRQTTR